MQAARGKNHLVSARYINERGDFGLETEHRFFYEDSRKMSAVKSDSIDLVITSPPYPMIEMWDEQFSELNSDVNLALQNSDYSRAFETMHRELDKVWGELFRVMKKGALACINIGDAARTINKRFQLFANHARIQKIFIALGFDVLPLILWRKQTNAPNKFMGSGMLPAGAYVTLEHEYILLFRKDAKRVFFTKEEKLNRRQSAYFWEERNAWFSDLWDFKGTRQGTNNCETRSRSGAFPFVLPFRLINMYSVYGDTVLDPFSGTGTTALAAMTAGRNSINYELDGGFSAPFNDSIFIEVHGLKHYNQERIRKHLEFVKRYQSEKGCLKYENSYFGFPVMTRQEEDLKFFYAKSVFEVEKNNYKLFYFEDRDVQAFEPEGLIQDQLQFTTGTDPAD